MADASSNVEAVVVDTTDRAGGTTDRPFRLVVVC